jgi:hypothetical protein
MMGREYNPSPLVLLVEVALSAVSFAGLLLNALVVLRQRSRRLVLVAWAVCNILALAKTPLLVASVHTGQWPAGQVLCSLYVAACTLQMWTGPWLLALAAMNLCIQVSESMHKSDLICCVECVVAKILAWVLCTIISALSDFLPCGNIYHMLLFENTAEMERYFTHNV